MSAIKLVIPITTAFLCACAQAPKVHLAALRNTGFERNWDTATILAIDNKRFSEPKQEIQVAAGQHVVLFGVSYMRGFMSKPIEAQVPLLATFEPNHDCYARGLPGSDGVTLGVWLFDKNTSKPVASAFAYNEEFSKLSASTPKKR